MNVNVKALPARRPYVRSMKGWWRRDPFFVRYMARELTAFAVLAYSIMLAVGLVRLAQGEAAWNGWLAAMSSPLAVGVHLVLLVSMVIHTQSWFQIMPKTMPLLFAGGERVKPETITRTGIVAAVVATLVVLAFAKWI
jgi:fumarate reductase subunit C